MPVLYSRPVEFTRDLTAEPTACSLFKGTRKQADFTYHPTWTLQDQRDLLQIYDVRQVRRQETRMFLKDVKHAFASTFASLTPFNSSTKKPSGNDDGAEPNDSGRGASSRKRTQPDDEFSDSDDDVPPPAKKGKGSRHNDDESQDQGDSGGDDGSEGNGGEEGDGGKSNSKKKKAPQRRKISSTIPTKSSDAEADQEVFARAAEILQANDPAMRNARRIAAKLKDLKLKDIVKPVVTDKSESRLENLLSQKPVSGRVIRPHKRKKETDQWIFEFKRGTGHIGKTGNFTNGVSYDALAKDAPDHEQQRLHEELARMCNAWPWGDDQLKPAVLQQFVPIAARNLWARPLQVDEVTHSDLEFYRTSIFYIDPQTGARSTLAISAAATETQMNGVSVPTLPALKIRKDTSGKVGKGGRGAADYTIVNSTPDQPYHRAAPVFKKKLGPTKSSPRWAQLRAEDAVYWLAAQLQGMVATPARMKELHVMYRKQIGLQKAASTKEGIYGGQSDMYRIAWLKARGYTLVQPTKKIHDDMGLTRKELSLYVHSLNASRATPVLEALIQLFCAGHDIRHVWIQAASIADLVNLDIGDGVAPSSQCDCDESMVSVEMHPCEGCTHPTICKTRSFDSMGRLVCGRCHQRDQGQPIAGRPSQTPGETLTAYLVRYSLWKNFKQECGHAGKDPNSKTFKAIFDDAWKQLEARLPGKGMAKNVSPDMVRNYTDEYTGLSHGAADERAQVGNNPSRRRYVPHGITVDAIRRQGHPSNSGLKHSGDNLAITSNACQMGKQVFSAGVLHEIGEFKRLSLVEQGSDKAREGLVEKLTAMAMVNCKRPYINAGKGSPEAKYEKIHAEAVAGQPTPGESGPWESKAKQYIQKRVPAYKPGGESIWDEKTWRAAQECAESMEKYFGVTLYRLQDGTAWAGTKYTTPEDLDRNTVAAFCRERLERMRTVCNKKWRTTDNDEKLYREILFQYCCSRTTKPELQHLKQRYGDRLGLPLVIWMHTPLRLSIAHRLHGLGMLTGWVSDHATDVKERIDNDENNNMLIESWYVNAAKFDMAEDYYHELDTILCAAKILNKAIYNPASLALLTAQATVTPSVGDLEAQDEYAGASFDTDSVTPDEETSVKDKSTKAGKSSAAPQPIDDDEEMVDVGDVPGAEVEGLKGDDDEGEQFGNEGEDATGAADLGGTASVGESELNTAISNLYQTILSHKGLQRQLTFDPDLRTILGQMQMAANDPTDPEAKDQFDQLMGQVHENYINKAQVEEREEDEE
ncbi:hypothetical protein PRZ48_014225 [Zasmidium cellare]|uniref:Uncharacterized protein n=1 Tax=Zasmidium cellare TaxID=395010 RepID=A0ABR0E0D8_ZASCE|nr:hypothetical protein PRZ48_014225 [Zasmidium cellare]